MRDACLSALGCHQVGLQSLDKVIVEQSGSFYLCLYFLYHRLCLHLFRLLFRLQLHRLTFIRHKGDAIIYGLYKLIRRNLLLHSLMITCR
jgi:hypothetical protein